MRRALSPGHFGGPFAADEPPPPKKCYFPPAPSRVPREGPPRPLSRAELIPQPRGAETSPTCEQASPRSPATSRRTGPRQSFQRSARPASAASQRALTPSPPSPTQEFVSGKQSRAFRIVEPPQVETETCKRREKQTWSATGFDHVHGSLATILRRLPSQPLDRKFGAVSDMLQRYEVDADTVALLDTLSEFVDDGGGLRDPHGFPGPSRTMRTCVVLDQLLLHLTRAYPPLKQITFDVRAALYDAVYIVAPADSKCGQIPPFENSGDPQEVDELLSRYDTRTYYQGVRELTTRLRGGGVGIEFEQEERKREKRAGCVDRAVVHWQRQYRALLLRAWRQHVAHQRELQRGSEREASMQRQIADRDKKIRSSEEQIWRLESELRKLKDTSELERRLEEASEMEQNLQRQLRHIRDEVHAAEAKKQRLEQDVGQCLGTLDAVCDALQPPRFKEFEVQKAVQDALTGKCVTPQFLMQVLNSVLDNAPDRLRKPSGDPFRIHTFSTPRVLMDPYIVVMHVLAPGAVPVEAATECLRRDEHDVVGKARQVLFFGKLLGIDLAITPKEFTNLFTAPQHIAYSTMLISRLCDPISIDHGARRAQGWFGAFDEPTFSVTKRACFSSFMHRTSQDQQPRRSLIAEGESSPRRGSASLRIRGRGEEDFGVRMTSPTSSGIGVISQRRASGLTRRTSRSAQGGVWKVSVETPQPAGDTRASPDTKDAFLAQLALGQGTEDSPWDLIASHSFRELKQVSFTMEVVPELVLSAKSSAAVMTAAANFRRLSASTQHDGEGIEPAAAASAVVAQTDTPPRTSLKGAYDAVLDVVQELTKGTQRVQEAIAARWKWNALAHTCLRVSLNALLDKLMARAPSDLTPLEQLWLPAFCNPDQLEISDLLETEPPTESLSLQRTLMEDYRLIRRIFMSAAEGEEEGDPRVPRESLWRLLETSHVHTAFPRFTRGVFDDVCRRTTRDASMLTPSDWMTVIVWVAHFVFAANPSMLLHEKVDWLFDRHIICYASVGDPTQCRETVYRTDVHAVISDYTVQLQVVFNHYSGGKNDVRVDDFLTLLTDCGLLPTRTEYARGQVEGKLKEVKCRDIFINIQVTSGERVITTANYATFVEILVAVAMYAFAHQPYVMLFRLVRRFVEAHLLLPLRHVIPELRRHTAEAAVSRSTRRAQHGTPGALGSPPTQGRRPSGTLSPMSERTRASFNDRKSPRAGQRSPKRELSSKHFPRASAAPQARRRSQQA
eukprot:TRINITY_DN9328_c0_g1_i1.p1 TRINITY_DN9328_c0_g1~~TRINITY_DN9328_c0_g1_i1.p1  ORF type:complete len:1241 (+),score=281.54 TRINITY_DN9328_c0_g1_i1:72-3794(+)